MTNRLRNSLSIAVVACGTFCFVMHADAKDHFLTIGGGPSVTSNQLSLERNVVFQQAILDERRPDHPDFEIWFADGNDESRDLQLRDPEFEKKCPPARRIMAELFGDPNSMDLIYRNSKIQGLKGPSDVTQVKDRFHSLAGELQSGDRVIIFATGHGGRGKRPERGRRPKTDSNPYNTVLYFWNSESVSASEFAEWLDRFPPDVEVVLVMAQCFAGGFSHTIFQNADAKKGLALHQRCGFFAQRYDRAAAGCTPDANAADYEEYSSCFWGALAGKARDGKSIDSADYDKNGVVSFAEAHAYAIIESETIDVPVRTSGALLRQYSQVGKPAEKPAPAKSKKKESDKKPAGEATAAAAASKAADAEFAELKGPISKLFATARSDQRAILGRLPAKCGLGADPTVEDIQKKLEKQKEKLAAARTALAAASRTARNKLKQVKEEVCKIWPELRAQYAPLAFELASDRAAEFAPRVQAMPDYKALCEAKAKEDESVKAMLQVERDTARLERLLATCEEVVLAMNLSRMGAPPIVQRYQQLLSMEEGTLANSSSPATSANASQSAQP